jgi:hypothetical protein
LEENLEDISFGLYKPHYDFETSGAYKAKLDEIYERQKQLVRAEKAIRAGAAWSVGGSRKEGMRMQKQYSKLLLRAFNGESDAAIARVAWNNVTRMEERVTKAFSAINELGGVMQISITPEYLDLRLQELRLSYELEEKKHAEAEEQRHIKEQMRDEEKALREAERAKQEAEAEEARYQKALEKARAELAKAKGDALTELNSKIEQLNQALQKAKDMKDKATTMAQLTRSGHVYVISNVGSFGDGVFKIGMTRRLEPMDRVHELGDASVPFAFDVHAMVFSEDAPTLECSFHERFEPQRVNLVNARKEFFAVTLADLEAFVKEKNLKIELTKIAEAKEYRQSIALREATQRKNSGPPPLPRQAAFPASL